MDFFRFGLFLNSSATDIVLVTLPNQQLRSALVAGKWRGDTALTLSLLWRRSTVSPVFFGRYPRSSLHSLALFPPPPSVLPSPGPVPNNKQPRFCGRKEVWSRPARRRREKAKDRAQITRGTKFHEREEPSLQITDKSQTSINFTHKADSLYT